LPRTARSRAGKILASALGMALYYDMDDPYHYVRRHRRCGQPYAIIGGADHKTGQNGHERGFTEMILRALPVPDSWRKHSGPANSQNPRMACRSSARTRPGSRLRCHRVSGNGMTFGTVAAMMLCDAVMGVKNRGPSFTMPRA